MLLVMALVACFTFDSVQVCYRRGADISAVVKYDICKKGEGVGKVFGFPSSQWIRFMQFWSTSFGRAFLG